MSIGPRKPQKSLKRASASIFSHFNGTKGSATLWNPQFILNDQHFKIFASFSRSAKRCLSFSWHYPHRPGWLGISRNSKWHKFDEVAFPATGEPHDILLSHAHLHSAFHSLPLRSLFLIFTLVFDVIAIASVLQTKKISSIRPWNYAEISREKCRTGLRVCRKVKINASHVEIRPRWSEISKKFNKIRKSEKMAEKPPKRVKLGK